MSRGKGKPTAKPAKANLPQKTCATCKRPFTWRKKWERVWDEVKYCSDKCRERPSA
jgi:hypothetical protein